MLNLTVNGEAKTLEAPCSLAGALPRLGYEGKHFAVAVNGDFVPRHRYSDIQLEGGEQMEVLFPMQGG